MFYLFQLRVSQEDTVEDCLAAMASGGSKQLRRRTSISLLSNDQVRSRVVRELINTERDFVKVLRDVAEVWEWYFIILNYSTTLLV